MHRDHVNLFPIMERMGTEATLEDARCMRALLADRGIEPSQIPELVESEWLALCDEAARMARGAGD